jgi:cytochrome P450
VAGPRGWEAARVLKGMLSEPLEGYLWLSARYGDAVRVPFAPGRSFFLLGRPEHAEHVLAAGQDNYKKAFTYRPLRMLVGDGLLTADGEHWRRHRRLVQPVFSRREVTSFGPLMTAAARRLSRRWGERADGSPVDVAGEMSALALEIAGQALFSSDLAEDARQVRRAMSIGQQVAILATLLPVNWGPHATQIVKAAAWRLTGVREGVDGPVRRMLAERRAAYETTSEPRDLLDVLVRARDEQGRTLTDAEIGDELATFLLAGHETTSNALAWSLALLSAYPGARQRMEEEADRVLGDRDPTAADVDRLTWTRAVARETLRLYPPAWTIERDALADDEVAGVHVPRASLVVISPYLIHRHHEFWPDPAGFDPCRFLPGGHGDPAVRHRYAFIPFGGGRRACIGASFAELEMVIVLASIARRFRLELTAAGIPLPLARVTLQPGRALPMRLSHRRR